MTTPPSLPPRGWYPDPAGSAAWRWWDGHAWTSDLEPFARPATIATAPLLTREAESAARLVPWGVLALAVALTLGIVIHAFETSYYVSMWHWFTKVWHDVENQVPSSELPKPPNESGGLQALSILVALPLELVGMVFVLTFQHRAATTAKAIGLPQRLSPTFGVIGWFIPFAGLVLPWIAWRDLLPRTHPDRSKMSAIWALYLGYGLFSMIAIVVSISSTAVAGLCLVAALASGLLALRLSPSIISVVLEAHQTGAQLTAPASDTALRPPESS